MSLRYQWGHARKRFFRGPNITNCSLGHICEEPSRTVFHIWVIRTTPTAKPNRVGIACIQPFDPQDNPLRYKVCFLLTFIMSTPFTSGGTGDARESQLFKRPPSTRGSVSCSRTFKGDISLSLGLKMFGDIGTTWRKVTALPT